MRLPLLFALACAAHAILSLAASAKGLPDSGGFAKTINYGQFLFTNVQYDPANFLLSGTVSNDTIADWSSGVTLHVKLKEGNGIGTPASFSIEPIKSLETHTFLSKVTPVFGKLPSGPASVISFDVDEIVSGEPSISKARTLIPANTAIAEDRRCLSDAITAAKQGGIDGRERLARAISIGCVRFTEKLQWARIDGRSGTDALIRTHDIDGWTRLEWLILSPTDAARYKPLVFSGKRGTR